MPDHFREVSHRGYGSRLGSSLGGVVGGVVLILVSFPLLWWNEGRAVQTMRSLEEGAGAVVNAKPDKVVDKHDGDLVHVTGEATTEETLRDEDFGIEARAIRLVREVEMYQWEEKKHTETRKKLGGGEETITTYDYEKTWSATHVSSSGFRHPAGHENPSSWPVESRDVEAKKVTLGAFTLPPELVARLDKKEPLPPGEAAEVPRHLGGRGRVDGGGFYVGDDPARPEVGDVRVKFYAVKPALVSVVAVQSGDSFEAYHAEAGDDVLLLEYGKKSADAMFESAQEANTVLTWILRVLGFFLMFGGFAAVFRPISVAGDVVPIFGSLLSAGFGLVAFLLAGALSSVTVAIAWVVYRPLVGIPLLALAVGMIALAVVLGRRRKAASG